MLRIGVIGAGSMGQNHIRVYSNMKDVELIGIADPAADRVKALASQYKTNYFLDHKALLKEEPDAVSIVVPTGMHKPVALDAINSGVNVLLEKPISDTLEHADEIITAAEKKKVKLQIGHIERFNPVVLKLKEEIDSGALGKVVSMSTIRVGPYNPRIRDVGIITDLGVHDIDIMSYLYNETIKSVHAYAGSVIHNFEDYATVLAGFNNGHSGVIETNWLTPHRTRKLTVTGTEAIAYADYIEQTLRICDKRGEALIRIDKKEPLMNELSHFVSCVSGNKSPMVSGLDGRNALEVALAAIKSYKENKTIIL